MFIEGTNRKLMSRRVREYFADSLERGEKCGMREENLMIGRNVEGSEAKDEIWWDRWDYEEFLKG